MMISFSSIDEKLFFLLEKFRQQLHCWRAKIQMKNGKENRSPSHRLVRSWN